MLLLPVKQQQQPQMLRVGSALKLLRLLLPPVKLQQQPQRLLRVGNAKGTTKSRRFRRLHDPPSGAPRVNRREALLSPSWRESHKVTAYGTVACWVSASIFAGNGGRGSGPESGRPDHECSTAEKCEKKESLTAC